MTEPINWQDLPSTATPLNAANLRHHDAWMIEQVEAAQASANAAADSAAEAAAPADDTIAALIASPGSGTRAQLDGRYATTTDVSNLQAQSASIEDLFVTFPVTSLGGSGNIVNTGPSTILVLVCPFPLRVTSLSFVFWNTVMATSDTNWWQVDLRRSTNAAQTIIATKTTRTTAGAAPAGQAIASWIPWKFTIPGAGMDFAADEVANLAFSFTGTPAQLGGPIIMTMGYKPL